jgi:hypothetical protein
MQELRDVVDDVEKSGRVSERYYKAGVDGSVSGPLEK